MTAPIRVGEDPLDALIAIKKQRVMSSADPLDELMSSKSKGSEIHEEYKSGRLAKRMQRENTNDREAAEAEDIGYAGRLATHAANLAQGIPGMEAVQAFVGSKVSGKPYRESLDNLRGATDQLPTVVKYGERIAGALPLASVLPGSAAASGAIIGGADQALSADPDQSMTERAVRTGLGAAGGAAIGKLTESAITAGKAALSPNVAKTLLGKQAERAASARNLYAQALQEGRNNPMTPEIHAFLQEPDIADIVGELQQTRGFQNIAADSPEMLDAVYKTLSDRAGVVKRGLQALTPNRPNVGRFQGQNIRQAQNQALNAMSGTPGHSPMPSYARAVDDYADRTREIEAIQKGYDAVRSTLSGNLPTAKNLTRKTPEAFAEWAGKASPQEVAGSRQGILGAAKIAMKPSANPLKGFGLLPALKASGQASALLRDAAVPSQQYLEILQNLGLLGAGSASTP